VTRPTAAVQKKGKLPTEVRQAVARGWRLLPVQTCGKIPLVPMWQKVATNDLAQLEEWEAQFPGCNWGLATGPESDLFALDVDDQRGEDSLQVYKRVGWKLPDTLTVVTGRGRHLYFRWPERQTIRNSRGKLAGGLDIRGIGGQVVIPPSLHPNGSQYFYANPDAPVVDAPR
jgi:hypothetical protein